MQGNENGPSGPARAASAAPKSPTGAPAVRKLLALGPVAVAIATAAEQVVDSRSAPGTLITRVSDAVAHAWRIQRDFRTPDVAALVAGFVVEFGKDGGK